MSDWQNQREREAKTIAEERKIYEGRDQSMGAKIFEKLSLIFLSLGFLSLPLIFLNVCTLLESTCLFVISFVLHPTDGDRYEGLLKGMAEDLANIRINTAIGSRATPSKKVV